MFDENRQSNRRNRSSFGIGGSWQTRYAVSIVITAVAIVLRYGFTEIWGAKHAFVFLLPAVLMSARIGGVGPGILSTTFCSLAVSFLWMAPFNSLVVGDRGDLIALASFAGIGCALSVFFEKSGRAALRTADSEERLERTLSSIGDAVITTDENGFVTRMNSAAELLTGWTEADARGKPAHHVFVVDDRAARVAENPVSRVLLGGAARSVISDVGLVARNGNESPIDGAVTPIKMGDGPPAGAVIVFRDVSARRLAERARTELFERDRSDREKKAEQRLQLALQAGRMGAWRWTVATGVVTWSPELESIHGLAPGSFPGTFEAVRNEIHPDDQERVVQAIDHALKSAKDYHVEYRIVRNDGAVRWVEGRGRAFFGPDGYPMEMAGVCSDITERKQAVETERAAARKAEEANRAKDEFLALLSHELRTPLSAILGWAAILRTGRLPSEQANHAFEVIERNAKAEVQLVDSLLDLSRIVAGQLTLDMAPVDLSPIVEGVVDSLKPGAVAKGVSLELELPAAPLIVTGEAGRLRQIVSNIVSNAVKFTPQGGHVRACLNLSLSGIEFQVIDDGEGISAEFLPVVFERFRQARSARTRPHGGLGLGLAIVRELVHAHGGTVRAESPGAGQGSTFTVTFPAPAGVAAPLTATPSQEKIGDERSIAKLRVLVADDDEDTRELVAFTLESRGAVVQKASSAGEAVQLIRQSAPDVLIADIGMPHEDGYALIRKLRRLEQDEVRRRLPAIALTAYASVTDREQALSAGYDLHLKKPVRPADLAAAVAGFMLGRGMSRRASS
ncbi:MAG TPA: ATP-binding protein [Terriglobia bacterium]|nr:ATP-binding protein [Terriglobia bacterium]